MKYILTALIASCTISSVAQTLTVEKLAEFSVQQVDSMIAVAVPIPGIIQAQYPVDLYKVTYLTPYRHPDSLVQASGAVAIPVGSECEFPLVGYGHGTQANRYNVASNMAGGQWDVNTIFASTGYAVAMPDYLGLGDADPSVIIHPYTHSFSQSNTMINALRTARHVCDTADVNLNGQVFLYGYSQGGGTTVVTVKEIQENYPEEFGIAGSAPMSGAYDLIDAQVDLIASDSVYPTPGYLPYILLGYQSMYPELFDGPSDILKAPYDSLIPPLFYDGNHGIGYINGVCTPVPKQIVLDSVVNEFLNDSLHPLRVRLRENDMIRDWFPTSPMKLFYCHGDDQVTYLNSETAYDYWVAQGADTALLEKQNFGDLDHGGCAPLAILAGKDYFDNLRQDCFTGVEEPTSRLEMSVFPNPAKSFVTIALKNSTQEDGYIQLVDATGRSVKWQEIASKTTNVQLPIQDLAPGMYILRVQAGSATSFQRLIVE